MNVKKATNKVKKDTKIVNNYNANNNKLPNRRSPNHGLGCTATSAALNDQQTIASTVIMNDRELKEIISKQQKFHEKHQQLQQHNQPDYSNNRNNKISSEENITHKELLQHGMSDEISVGASSVGFERVYLETIPNDDENLVKEDSAGHEAKLHQSFSLHDKGKSGLGASNCTTISEKGRAILERERSDQAGSEDFSAVSDITADAVYMQPASNSSHVGCPSLTVVAEQSTYRSTQAGDMPTNPVARQLLNVSPNVDSSSQSGSNIASNNALLQMLLSSEFSSCSEDLLFKAMNTIQTKLQRTNIVNPPAAPSQLQSRNTPTGGATSSTPVHPIRTNVRRSKSGGSEAALRETSPAACNSSATTSSKSRSTTPTAVPTQRRSLTSPSTNCATPATGGMQSNAGLISRTSSLDVHEPDDPEVRQLMGYGSPFTTGASPLRMTPSSNNQTPSSVAVNSANWHGANVSGGWVGSTSREQSRGSGTIPPHHADSSYGNCITCLPLASQRPQPALGSSKLDVKTPKFKKPVTDYRMPEPSIEEVANSNLIVPEDSNHNAQIERSNTASTVNQNGSGGLMSLLWGRHPRFSSKPQSLPPQHTPQIRGDSMKGNKSDKSISTTAWDQFYPQERETAASIASAGCDSSVTASQTGVDGDASSWSGVSAMERTLLEVGRIVHSKESAFDDLSLGSCQSAQLSQVSLHSSVSKNKRHLRSA